MLCEPRVICIFATNRCTYGEVFRVKSCFNLRKLAFILLSLTLHASLFMSNVTYLQDESTIKKLSFINVNHWGQKFINYNWKLKPIKVFCFLLQNRKNWELTKNVFWFVPSVLVKLQRLLYLIIHNDYCVVFPSNWKCNIKT